MSRDPFPPDLVSRAAAGRLPALSAPATGTAIAVASRRTTSPLEIVDIPRSPMTIYTGCTLA
jgi:hypothetical protein